MREKITGIYKIENTVNGKCYVGESVDIMKRWGEHKRDKNDKPLYRAFNKYGIENFTFQILEEMSGATKDELLDRELHYKQVHNSYAGDGGYNIVKGREGAQSGEDHPMFNKTHSPESIKKLSESAKGKKHSQVTLDRLSETSKGNNNWIAKPVISTCRSTGKVAEYRSCSCAALAMGNKSHSLIARCCRGERKSAYGHTWDFK